MPDKKNEQHSDSRNEGEGNKTAAREYNKAQRRFVQSGKVEEKATFELTFRRLPERRLRPGRMRG